MYMSRPAMWWRWVFYTATIMACLYKWQTTTNNPNYGINSSWWQTILNVTHSYRAKLISYFVCKCLWYDSFMKLWRMFEQTFNSSSLFCVYISAGSFPIENSFFLDYSWWKLTIRAFWIKCGWKSPDRWLELTRNRLIPQNAWKSSDCQIWLETFVCRLANSQRANIISPRGLKEKGNRVHGL